MRRLFNFSPLRALLSIASLENTVNGHLFRVNFEVLLVVVLCPVLLMFESSYGNAWTFSGGHLIGLLDGNTWVAFFRGFALEAFTFGSLKITHIMFVRGWKWALLSVVPFSSGVIAMIVSAGCNLGYINHGGELAFAVRSAAVYLGPLSDVFKTGVGLIFPIGVGVFSLFDVKELIDHAIESSRLQQRADRVRTSSIWRKKVMAHQEQAIEDVDKAIAEICKADAQNMLAAVKSGDYSYGMDALQAPVKTRALPAGRTAISPASIPTLPAAPGQRQLSAPAIPAQLSQPPAFSSGSTGNIQIPPPASPQMMPYRP